MSTETNDNGTSQALEVELPLVDGTRRIAQIDKNGIIKRKIRGHVLTAPVEKTVRVPVTVDYLEPSLLPKRLPVDHFRAQYKEEPEKVSFAYTLAIPSRSTQKRKGYYTDGPNGTLVEIEDEVYTYDYKQEVRSEQAQRLKIELKRQLDHTVDIPRHVPAKKKGFRVDTVLEWEAVQYQDQVEYLLKPVRVLSSEKIALGKARPSEGISEAALQSRTFGKEIIVDDDITADVSELPLDTSITDEPVHG